MADYRMLELSSCSVRVYTDDIELDVDGAGTWTLTADDIRACAEALDIPHRSELEAERNQLLAEVNKAQDESEELEATAARYWSIIGVYAAALESISENSNDPEAASVAREALNGGTDD